MAASGGGVQTVNGQPAVLNGGNLGGVGDTPNGVAVCVDSALCIGVGGQSFNHSSYFLSIGAAGIRPSRERGRNG